MWHDFFTPSFCAVVLGGDGTVILSVERKVKFCRVRVLFFFSFNPTGYGNLSTVAQNRYTKGRKS